ncbi:hypothetical protein mistaenkt_60 [Escherichia phage mistaenkt]|uniref:Minor tail protein n=1 Tax=Escherichia phage mistaenkt TaxID=2696420 RepID=A0A6B9WVG2_9CAUD|nr:hypothetical protein mistaenkt_60 [Escherichia phage mistaenkt]
MTTVNEMLASKGIDSNFMLNTVESLAIVMRSNTFSSQATPESYQVNAEISDESAFRSQVELLLNNRQLALASVAVGVDAFAGYVFDKMQTGDYKVLSEEEKEALLEFTEDETFNLIINSIASVMAVLEKRVQEKLPRYEKLDWGFADIFERSQEMVKLTKEQLQEVVDNEAERGLDEIQVKLTALVPSIITVMSIHALFEVAGLIDAPIEFVEQIAGNVSGEALREVIMQTGAAVLQDKIAIHFGDEFVATIQALSDKEKLDSTQIH